MNEDTRPLLQFKDKNGLRWYDVHSPSGTYGRHGSLEAYAKYLEDQGHETRVLPVPIKRCPHCNQALPEQD